MDKLPTPVTCICLYLRNSSLVVLRTCWVASSRRTRADLGRQNLPFPAQGSQVPDPEMSIYRACPLRVRKALGCALMPFPLSKAPPPLLQVSYCRLSIMYLESFLSPVFPFKYPPFGASGKRLDQLLNVEASVIDSVLLVLMCYVLTGDSFLS